MNGRLKVKKEFPHCIDCGYPLLPRPAELRDGCIVRPFRCLVCDEEKDVWVIEVLQHKPDDRFAPGQYPAQASAGGV